MQILIFIAALLVADTAATESLCRFDSGADYTCYVKTTASANWAETKTECEANDGIDGHLASIETAEEQAFLNANLDRIDVSNEDELWFGAQYNFVPATTAGTWRFTSNTQGTPDLGGITAVPLPDTATDPQRIGLIHLDTDWAFLFVTPGETGHEEHFVLCETDSNTLPEGADVTITITTPDRYFHAFITEDEDERTWEGAVALCNGVATGRLAEIESDAILTEIKNAVPGPASSILQLSGVEHLWTGLHAGVWQWNHDDSNIAAPYGWEVAYTPGIGCGYLEYDGTTDAERAVWVSDYDCEHTDGRNALCEYTSTVETQICRDEGEEGVHCYYITGTTASNWATQRGDCEDGFDLLVIDNQAEQDWLSRNLPRLGVAHDGDGLWFGAIHHDSAWTWLEGEEITGDHVNWQGDTVPAGGCGSITHNEVELEVVWHGDNDCGTETKLAVCEISLPRICTDYSCYQTTISDGTWTDARSECQEKDMDLVTIESQVEQDFLNQNLNELVDDNTELWIGASSTGGDWTWVDTESVDFTNWEEDHEPEDDGFGYLLYNEESAYWRSAETAVGPKKAICEKERAEDPGDGEDPTDDGGLSDGEIAAIAVSSTVVVGGAAAGGGYYAYSKKSSGKVADAEAGGEGENYQKDEEDEEKQEGEEGEQEGGDPTAEET